MPLQGGLIGCGFFARNHLHAWQDIPGVTLVACCDRDPVRLAQARETFGIARAYTDAVEMFACERLDFVDIVTTMPSHRALVELAAQNGVAPIVQKPLAPSWEDGLAMVAACDRADVLLMVHENFRFQTPVIEARRVVESGAIGRPVFCRVSFRTNHDVIAAQPYLAREERFIVLDLGVHVLDVARVFMGDAETIYCQTQRVRPGIAGEDMATMMLSHAGGTTSVVDCSYSSPLLPDPFPQTLLHVEGTAGSVRIEQDFRMIVTSAGARHETDVSAPPLSWGTPPWEVTQGSVLNAQRHFAECLARGVPAQTSGDDNLRSFALVMAAYRSAEERRAIRPLTRRDRVDAFV